MRQSLFSCPGPQGPQRRPGGDAKSEAALQRDCENLCEVGNAQSTGDIFSLSEIDHKQNCPIREFPNKKALESHVSSKAEFLRPTFVEAYNWAHARSCSAGIAQIPEARPFSHRAYVRFALPDSTRARTKRPGPRAVCVGTESGTSRMRSSSDIEQDRTP